MYKRATTLADLEIVEGIMAQIYAEDPSYWPHGLRKEAFDPGGLYLVKEAASGEPAGFVGWQTRLEGERKVGYYVIGMLPERRGQGLAKEAVANIIRDKSGGVDEVKAFIMPHNSPSLRLARSLGVPVVGEDDLRKAARRLPWNQLSTAGKLWRALAVPTALGTGTATAAGVDSVTYGDDGVVGKIRGKGDFDEAAVGDFLLNFMVGSAAPFVPSTTAKIGLPVVGHFTTIGSAAGRNQRTAHDIAQGQVDGIKELADAIGRGRSLSDADKLGLGALGAGALGLGGVGLALYAANERRKARLQEAMLDTKGKGMVRVTLPTRSKDDSETEVVIPFDELNLSQALRNNLGRDTRRRLLAETRERTKRRTPRDKKNPTAKEIDDMEVEREHARLEKASSRAGWLPGVSKAGGAAGHGAPPPPGGVPTPPHIGQNPAVRHDPAQAMMAQRTAAQSIQPSTEANPQIMQAQQESMQAQQQAEMQMAEMQQQSAAQMAQMEQQMQAAQMEQQQRFQDELSKKEHEAEMLKLRLEKEKARAELEKTRTDLERENKGAGEDGAMRSAKVRLDRLGGRVSSALRKSGGTTGAEPWEAGTGAFEYPTLPKNPTLRLRDNTGHKLNSSPTAAGVVGTLPIYRTAVNPLYDMLYRNFMHNRMYGARPRDVGAFGSETNMRNAPDKLDMFRTMYGHGKEYLGRPQMG
jgi:RimJ/RimL family protein N-acetyltransferase